MGKSVLSKKKRILFALKHFLSPPFRLLREPKLWAYSLIFSLMTLAAHPPIGAWPLGFVVYALLISITLRRTPIETFWIALLAGTMSNSILYSWLHVLARFNPAIYLGIPVLGFFQGLYLALSLWGIRFALERMPRLPAAIVGAAWFIVVEWARANGPLGAPLAQAGHVLIDAYGINQWAAVGGVLLLSGIVMLFNLSLALLLDRFKRKTWNIDATWKAVITLLVLFFCFGSGTLFRLQLDEQLKHAKTVNVAVLQSNISQDVKFASYTEPDEEKREALQQQLIDVIFEQLTELEKSPIAPDIILTPESCFTVDDFDRNVPILFELQSRSNKLNAAIVVGSTDLSFRTNEGGLTDNLDEARLITHSNGQRYYDYEVSNALFVFHPGEKLSSPRKADYSKIHLMPFGETVPFFHLIPGFVENIVQVGMMLPGEKTQKSLNVRLKNGTPLKLGASICFEDLFPGLFHKYNREQTNLFINATNNAWFDPSWGSEYHFGYSRFRSIEFQTPAVRATNTGVTAVSLATGEVMKRLPREKRMVEVLQIPYFQQPITTLYGRFGDWMGWLSLLIVAGFGIVLLNNSSRKSS